MTRRTAKIIIVLGVILVSVLYAQASDAVDARFSDVPENHPQEKEIQALKEAGLVNGYGDGTFKPDKPVSRAEAVAMILKGAGITAVKTQQKLRFTDVPENTWFYPMIQKGVAMKKLKGFEDRTFRPDNPVIFVEALAMTLSFFQINTKEIKVEPVIYEGLSTSGWYAKSAQYAKNMNLVMPKFSGRVEAGKELTRGELAELIFRMRTVQQTKTPIDITGGWIETEHIDNFWKLRHPANWEIFKGAKNSVIYTKTPLPAFFTRIWPAGGRLSVSVVENPENLTAAQYFAKLKTTYVEQYENASPVFSEIQLSGKPALKIFIPSHRVIDAVVALPNKSFLYMNGDYGSAPLGEWHRKELELIISSYQFVERPPEPPKPVIPLEQRMETLRENVLVEGMWKDIAPLFPDKKLISTDAIGVGTGPVDYYFSAEANQTIKLERSSGTVLNIREGETSAF